MVHRLSLHNEVRRDPPRGETGSTYMSAVQSYGETALFALGFFRHCECRCALSSFELNFEDYLAFVGENRKPSEAAGAMPVMDKREKTAGEYGNKNQPHT